MDLAANSKRQVLQTMARVTAEDCGLGEETVYRALLEREKLGTTGIGEGLAIPHAKSDRISEVVGAFARLEHAVDFDALDEEPVDLVFVILAPANSGAEHLKALARVARIFRDRDLCRRLREAESAGEAYRIMADRPPPDAA